MTGNAGEVSVRMWESMVPRRTLADEVLFRDGSFPFVQFCCECRSFPVVYRPQCMKRSLRGLSAVRLSLSLPFLFLTSFAASYCVRESFRCE